MRIRSYGATALHLLLLLSSLLEAAGHELLCRDEAARPAAGVELAVEGAQIGAGVEQNGDDCPYCGLCALRFSLSPSSTTAPTFVVAEVRAAGRADPFVKTRAASHPSRGPPITESCSS